MLSVIICTYNREKYIRPLLESLAANDLPKNEYEILLVDNNCTDNTRAVCGKFCKAHPGLTFRYMTEPEQGLSAARNKGIRNGRRKRIQPERRRIQRDSGIQNQNYFERRNRKMVV